MALNQIDDGRTVARDQRPATAAFNQLLILPGDQFYARSALEDIRETELLQAGDKLTGAQFAEKGGIGAAQDRHGGLVILEYAQGLGDAVGDLFCFL